MKDLIASFFIVVILISGWLFFDSYSHKTSIDLSTVLLNDIIPMVEDENWEEAHDMYNKFEDKWKKYKDISLAFLENDQISELDLCIARAEKYIEAEDVSNSAGELCSISKQLDMLYKREKVTLSNVL